MVVDRAVIIKPEEFTPERVERICHDLLNAFGQVRGMRRLIIGTPGSIRALTFSNRPYGLASEATGTCSRLTTCCGNRSTSQLFHKAVAQL